MRHWYSGDDPPGLAGGGGVAQGPGTAIADNKAVRGDTSGIQGSAVTISDSAAITCGDVLVTPSGSTGGDERVQISTSYVRLATDVSLRWYSDTDISSGSPDSGLERQSSGVVKVTNGTTGNGSLMVGGAVCRGFTTSAGTPGTAQFPNNKDFGFHLNSATGEVSVSFNNGGVVVSALLAEIL